MQPHTVLLFSPPMVRAQRPPCLELDLWFGDASSTTAGATSSTRAVRPHPPPTRTARPEFSLVVNVFNHASTIERVLRQALKLTTEAAELIVFFDGCTDRSVEVANALIERYARGWPACKSDAEAADPRTECTARAGDTVKATARSRVDLGHVRFIVQPANNSVFETSGNNIAMRAAVGKYIVIMQDDMYLTEYGWNTRLAAAPRQYSDVLSVSAMCAHTLHPLGADKVGPCGALAAHARRMSTASAATRNTFHLRPTSNRGPLLIDADKLAEIGYLDEWNYRIFNDDHDLHCRAALDRGWVTGHVPIGFTLNLSEGGVRINKKRQKPAYEIEFIAARNARYNRRDCFRARKKEYIEAVKNGSVVTSGARPLGTHL
jgi:glycosyltransferase involved in cell wall biosynthesis